MSLELALNTNKDMVNTKSNEQELNNNLEKEKGSSFFSTGIGQIVNKAIDIGLRLILPNYLEDGIISAKNSLLKGGLGEAVDSTISNVASKGTELLGTKNNVFKNIKQIGDAFNTGDFKEGISKAIDTTLKQAQSAGYISKDVSRTNQDRQKYYFRYSNARSK